MKIIKPIKSGTLIQVNDFWVALKNVREHRFTYTYITDVSLVCNLSQNNCRCRNVNVSDIFYSVIKDCVKTTYIKPEVTPTYI